MGTAATNDRYDDAMALFNGGDFQAARELALSGLADEPKDVNLLRLAGRSSAELDLSDATAYLEQAVEIDPENADAWRDLAEALLYQNRLNEAMSAIQHALELRPDDAAGLIDLGHGALVSGRTDEAVSYFVQAVERDPGSVAARRSLIEVYRATGRTEEALKAAENLAGVVMIERIRYGAGCGFNNRAQVHGLVDAFDVMADDSLARHTVGQSSEIVNAASGL